MRILLRLILRHIRAVIAFDNGRVARIRCQWHRCIAAALLLVALALPLTLAAAGRAAIARFQQVERGVRAVEYARGNASRR